MKKWMKGIAFLALAVALAACGEQGKEYVGKWQSKGNAKATAAIERNGDNFVLKISEPVVYGGGKTETTSTPAVYKDGMLELSNGFSMVKISYVKDTDTLLMPTMGGSVEYSRVK